MSQDAAEIRDRIKQIIANVAGLDPERIGDEARLRDELKLDSLSLLEIGVDVDLAFKLELPGRALQGDRQHSRHGGPGPGRVCRRSRPQAV